MFNVSLVPIVAIIFIFILFLSHYWILIHTQYTMLQKIDAAISILNANYFANVSDSRIKYNPKGKLVVEFPVYKRNKIHWVGMDAGNL